MGFNEFAGPPRHHPEQPADDESAVTPETAKPAPAPLQGDSLTARPPRSENGSPASTETDESDSVRKLISGALARMRELHPDRQGPVVKIEIDLGKTNTTDGQPDSREPAEHTPASDPTGDAPTGDFLTDTTNAVRRFTEQAMTKALADSRGALDGLPPGVADALRYNRVEFSVTGTGGGGTESDTPIPGPQPTDPLADGPDRLNT